MPEDTSGFALDGMMMHAQGQDTESVNDAPRTLIRCLYNLRIWKHGLTSQSTQQSDDLLPAALDLRLGGQTDGRPSERMAR